MAETRSDLRADCAACTGLCCVALAFSRSSDFAVDKGAGEPCRHLAQDFACRIHPVLRESGYPGCTAFDCFGAGQKVSQHTAAGADWRADAATASAIFTAFPVVRALHETLWYLAEATARASDHALLDRLREMTGTTERLSLGTAAELASLDLAAHRAAVDPLLRRASELVRAGVPGPRGRDREGADLLGAELRRTPLRGAGLRGALLIGADLRGVDLTGTDLLGADLRAADLRGADLSGSLFLTQVQVGGARGDDATRLPAALLRPGHWGPAGHGGEPSGAATR